jgi:hypothetical protein
MAYTSNKQLGGILNVDDVTTTGEIIGTAQEMAQSRALVFNQETAGISVTLRAPVPPTAKQIYIINKGTANLIINGQTIKPNPAYSFYWTGGEYVPMQVEGVGVVSNTLDGDTVAFTGLGSPDDPLTAEVKISAAPNNNLVTTPQGLFAEKINTGASTLYVVDRVNGVDTNAGDWNHPWKTIGKALSTIPNNTQAAVAILPGTYNEDLVLPANKRILAFAFGAKDSSTVKVTGKITNEADAANIRLKNIQVEGKVGQTTLEFANADGSIIFDDCSLSHVSGDGGLVVNFAAGNTGWYAFKGGSIKGQVSVPANNSNITVYFEDSAEPFIPTLANVAASVLIAKMLALGTVTHSGGNLAISDIGRVIDTGGVAISSTANSGFLSLRNINLAQAGGGFGDLVKTGTCDFILANVHRDPVNNEDGFTGTQILVDSAVDIHSSYDTPTAYTPHDETIRGHLQGINDALAATGGGLSAVDHSNTDTISFNGSGSPGNPLFADVRISSASNNALTTNPDGLYVPISDVGMEEVFHANSDTVDITGSGTSGDPLIAEVSLSTNPKNRIDKDAGGLLVLPQPRTAVFLVNVAYNWLDDDVIFEHVATEAFTLKEDLQGSTINVIYSGPDTTPGGQDFMDTQILIQKNGGYIGDILFNGTSETITFNGDQSFSVNDILTLKSTTEDTFKHVSISLAVTRPD